MEIKVEDVTYCYNDKMPFASLALDRVRLSLASEKINGILGKSGSGKTTLLELMNALLIPQQGRIQIDSFVIEKGVKLVRINDLRVNIGLVFQFPEEQFFENTVEKEIAFGMKYFHYKTEQIRERVIDSLKMVGLSSDYLFCDPLSLSSGEKRRVAIASVLAFNPGLLLLDEPTIGLDGKSKKQLVKLLKMMKNRYHKTIVVVSHDVDFLYDISDYIYVLDHGQLILEGKKTEIFKEKDKLQQYGIIPPKLVLFADKVEEQTGIKMGYRDDINDLIKDIYRYVK